MPQYVIKEHIISKNFQKGNNKRNLFIVIHYTANNGDTALGNAQYFGRSPRKASAQYIVDENPIVWCAVKPTDIAYHCGTTGTYFHKYCRNSNSIGIEMCSRKDSTGKYYFKENTVDTTARLTAELMKKYSIPISNVIRHYDVTHKVCPEPFVRDISQWDNFKKLVLNYYEGNELTMTQYEELKNLIINQASVISDLQSKNKSLEQSIKILRNENDILKEAIGWDSSSSDPSLYAYNDSNLGKISKDANEIIGKLICEGKLSVDDTGKFAPLCKAMIRLLIIQNR